MRVVKRERGGESEEGEGRGEGEVEGEKGVVKVIIAKSKTSNRCHASSHASPAFIQIMHSHLFSNICTVCTGLCWYYANTALAILLTSYSTLHST